MKKETKNIARLEILNFIVSTCTVKCFGENSFSMGNKDRSFHGTYLNEQRPPIGSLVILNAAPYTKYYLGWLRDIKQDDSRYSVQYLIESIEDGDTCWWNNVSIFYLPLEVTQNNFHWQWTDRQFEFKERWFNACNKKRDAYITLPCFPIFLEDGGVILQTRTRFGLNDKKKNPSRQFKNWKKVTIKEMLDFYDAAVKE